MLIWFLISSKGNMDPEVWDNWFYRAQHLTWSSQEIAERGSAWKMGFGLNLVWGSQDQSVWGCLLWAVCSSASGAGSVKCPERELLATRLSFQHTTLLSSNLHGMIAGAIFPLVLTFWRDVRNLPRPETGGLQNNTESSSGTVHGTLLPASRRFWDSRAAFACWAACTLGQQGLSVGGIVLSFCQQLEGWFYIVGGILKFRKIHVLLTLSSSATARNVSNCISQQHTTPHGWLAGCTSQKRKDEVSVGYLSLVPSLTTGDMCPRM